MKYWRGYLVAGIVALCTWALNQFAAAHSELIDMVYPYITRIVMDYLADWSAGISACLWQIVLIFFIVLVLASAVLMIVFRWNPIQWLGWVLTAVSVIGLLNTGLYGLNQHSGSLAEDIRLELRDYSVGSLERAAHYYAENANAYSTQVSRNSKNQVEFSNFAQLSEQAADGFEYLAYTRTFPTFTGSTVPVKELGFTGFYGGVTGKTVALTGESAVNPNVPDVGMPYAICHEMTHRMCVYSCTDAELGAFLSCTANSSAEYRYSGYLMAFRECYNALSAIHTDLGREALNRVLAEVSSTVLADMEQYNNFLKNSDEVNDDLCKLLVSWHIQEVDQYNEVDEDAEKFDPMDETDERFQDILIH